MSGILNNGRGQAARAFVVLALAGVLASCASLGPPDPIPEPLTTRLEDFTDATHFPQSTPVGFPVVPSLGMPVGVSLEAGVALYGGGSLDEVLLVEIETNRVLRRLWSLETESALGSAWPRPTLSGDGSTVAIAADETVYILDAATGKPTHRMSLPDEAFQDGILALALDHAGDRLYVARDAGAGQTDELVSRVTVWDINSGRVVGTPYTSTRGESIVALAVSANGERIVVEEEGWRLGPRRDGRRRSRHRVRVIDGRSGEVEHTFDFDEAEDGYYGTRLPGLTNASMISPGGRYVAFSTDSIPSEGERVTIYDLETDAAVARVLFPYGGFFFGSDSRLVAPHPGFEEILRQGQSTLEVTSVSMPQGGRPAAGMDALPGYVVPLARRGILALAPPSSSQDTLDWAELDVGTGRPREPGEATARLAGGLWPVAGSETLVVEFRVDEEARSGGFVLLDRYSGSVFAELSPYEPEDAGYSYLDPLIFDLHLFNWQIDSDERRVVAQTMLERSGTPVPVLVSWARSTGWQTEITEIPLPSGSTVMDEVMGNPTVSTTLASSGEQLVVTQWQLEDGLATNEVYVGLLDYPSLTPVREWSEDYAVASASGARAAFVSEDQFIVYGPVDDAGSYRRDGGEWTVERIGFHDALLNARDRDLFITSNAISIRAYRSGTVAETLWEVDTDFGNSQLLPSGNPDTFFAFYHDDGLLEQRSVADGSLLASTLVDIDSREWLTWTPDGYFAGSESAIEGALYIVDGLSTYGIGQLFDRYYRPDIIEARIAGRDVTPEAPEEELADTLLPLPEVRLEVERADGSFSTLTPAGMAAEGVASQAATAANTALSRLGGGAPVPISESNIRVEDGVLRLQIVAADRGGGAEELRLFHNGARVSGDTRGLVAEGGGGSDGGSDAVVREFAVPLVDGENVFRAVAYTRTEIESNPAIISLSYEAPRVVQPTLWVLAVGINEYQNSRYDLNYATGDAQGFVRAVSARGRGLFSEVETTLVSDTDATRERIISAIEEIAGRAAPEDVFMFFYAGHGIAQDPDGDGEADFFFVPTDVTQMTDPAQLEERALSGPLFEDLVSSVPARKQFHVLDACNAGAINTAFGIRGAAEEIALSRLSKATGSALIAASRDDQFAQEFEALGQGALTRALLDGLDGAAANADGQITVGALKSYVEQSLPELTAEHAGGEQYPTGFIFGQDFPVGVR